MTQIYHAHLYGTRDSKYDWLQNHDVLSTNWQELKPQAPFYLLVPQNTDLLGEYNQGWKITEVMPVNSVGILTARDSLTIHWTREELWSTIRDFACLDPEVAREKYQLSKDARDWKVAFAQEDLRKSEFLEENLVPIFYRPFDIRYTYYTGNSRGFHCMPRDQVMRHFLLKNNLGFHLCRQTSIDDWAHIFATSFITDDCYVSNKTSERGYTLPLYLYPDRTELTQDRRVNFSPEFLKDLTAKLDTTPAPEAIFYYIYAVFHSPTYRHRYAEFLKIDFPRVPLTRNLNLFQKLAAYGEELVSLHLMQSPKLDAFVTEFEGNLNPVVDAGHPKYVKGKVVINKKGDGFTAVPEEVWSFYVGGYQVCQKWLKDRKGRTLSPEDITHYQRIIVALQETIRLMQQIDEAIPGFPLE